MNEFKNTSFEKHSRKLRSSFYVNWFFSLRCAPDLMPFFPNAKEMTESFGAFAAAEKYVPMARDKGVVVCVGDGHTPRTAATFAFRTGWDCHSVDPVLRPKEWKAKRLVTHPLRIQEIDLAFDCPTLICLVHAHVALPICLDHIHAPERHVVAIPCCVNQVLPELPDYHYIDDHIWSPKNETKVWLKV